MVSRSDLTTSRDADEQGGTRRHKCHGIYSTVQHSTAQHSTAHTTTYGYCVAPGCQGALSQTDEGLIGPARLGYLFGELLSRALL